MDRFVFILLTLAAVMTGREGKPHLSPVGETAPDHQRPFFYNGSAPGIALNEIMADPTPVVGLPDAEWIELINAGPDPVSLKGWSLRVGSYLRSLPDSMMLPGQIRILCDNDHAPDLGKLGEVIILQSFPPLRNSGNRIILTDQTGTEADVIDYADTWYGDKSKSKGGWSLERIDPSRKCGQRANWKASNHPMGGTPGKVNTHHAPNPDTVHPEISSITTVTPSQTEIVFSEAMDTIPLKKRDNYWLSEKGNPDSVRLKDGNTVTLDWATPLQPNVPYALQCLSLTDECGNELLNREAELEWVVPKPGEVVIHEILFNPWPGGNDFIEIFNASSRNIDAARLMIAGRDKSGELKNLVSLKQAAFTLRKESLIALTTDTMGVIPFYPDFCRGHIREVASLPPMNNDQGCVVLLNDSLLVLDEVNYDENMHHPLLSGGEGVSLERINPRLPAGDRGNWHSASSLAGYATPGCPNSQHPTDPDFPATVVFTQTAFSPDNDGYNDELLISYQVPEPGVTGCCQVFDLRGNVRINLLNNAILGPSGTIRWNGKDETGSLLPPGPYIVLLELFTIKGWSSTFKKGVVLTRKGQ